jgi:hypothetical protein
VASESSRSGYHWLSLLKIHPLRTDVPGRFTRRNKPEVAWISGRIIDDPMVDKIEPYSIPLADSQAAASG